MYTKTMGDVSSASDESKRRRHHKKRKAVEEPKIEIDAPNDLSELAEMFAFAEASIPRLKGIQDLFREHPHMANSKGAEMPECTAALSKLHPDSRKQETGGTSSVLAASLLSVDEIAENHRRECMTKPQEFEIFRERFKELVVPKQFLESDLRGELTDEQHRRNLETGQVQIEVNTADLESSLLVQAGSFTHENGTAYNYPECRQGHQCVGSQFTIPGLTEPIRLMSMMYQDEYDTFIATQVSPKNPRPCVLCCRSIATAWVQFSRWLKMNDKPGLLTPHPTNAHEMMLTKTVQLNSNAINCPNGYRDEVVMKAMPNEPILQSIVCLRLSDLTASKQSNNQWKIHQDALLWKPKPLPRPRVGENFMSFCAGAG